MNGEDNVKKKLDKGLKQGIGDNWSAGFGTNMEKFLYGIITECSLKNSLPILNSTYGYMIQYIEVLS